jgi:protein phosphatase
MSRFEPQIHCVNPTCDRPLNRLDAKVCANCGTVIQRRYLWAVGDSAATKKPKATADNTRYYVVEPNVWLDLKPTEMPEQPPELPENLLPYLYMYPQRLHVPEVYGFATDGTGEEILLLDNAAVSDEGKALPTIAVAWRSASATRQVYWLWQILQLWQPLHQWDAVGSLLDGYLIRVQDWRIRLQELQPSHPSVTLSDLASIWQIWLPEAKPAIVPALTEICHQMQQSDATVEKISQQLNQLLLQQAAQAPLRLQAHGATDTGKARTHNEDSCYPLGSADVQDELTARLSLVCDGIGGHEGGEVASQMAMRLLRPQLQALLTEIAQQPDIVAPELIYDQLQAMVRVVNNVISNENDSQEREARRRMGTTIVLGLQVPQRVKLPTGAVSGNAHELYVLSVGDSRAYWVTAQACHRLTVDDDVAAREVKMGRSIYPEAIRRPDGGALTQALGMRDGEYLRPNIYRFIIEDDGLLLLCSDGLSDRDLIETHWKDYSDPVLKGRISLEDAVNNWVKLANEKNGTDNISVVLSRAEVSVKPNLNLAVAEDAEVNEADLSELADSEPGAALLNPTETAKKPRKNPWGWLLALLLLGGGGGGFAWSQLDPGSFEPVRDRVQTQIQEWRDRFMQR